MKTIRAKIVMTVLLTTMPQVALAQSAGRILRQLLGVSLTTEPVGRLASTPASLVPLAPGQAKSYNDVIARAGVQPALAREWSAATPIIATVLKTVGCATDAKALHALNRIRIAPKTYDTSDDSLNYVAMGLGNGLPMKYHDRRTCVTLTRMTDVTMPALNAITLKAYYVSDSSGEARSSIFTFRKVDGEWFFDDLGWFNGR